MAKIRPGRREGVDTEIHRDLTTLARNNAISDALVISAEEDLAQVIADVQDLGMRVTLVHFAVDGNWTISRALRQESDDIIEIGGEQLRPYVELIVGADPRLPTRRTPLTCRSTRPGGMANGHSAAGGSYQPLPAGAVGHAPPVIYTAPVVAEYQRPAAQLPWSGTRDDRARDDRAREDRAREDRAREDRNRDDRNRDERPREDRPREDRPRDERPREDRPRENINGEAQPSRPEGYAGSVPATRPVRPDRPEPGPSSRPRSDDVAAYAGPQNGAEVLPGAPGPETQAPPGQLRRLPTRPGSPPPIAPVGPAPQSAQHSQYAAGPGSTRSGPFTGRSRSLPRRRPVISRRDRGLTY